MTTTTNLWREFGFIEPTTDHGFAVVRHFGVMDGDKKVELLLTAGDELIQIVNGGKWSGLTAGPGMTAAETYQASLDHVKASGAKYTIFEG